jgi:hypothetical protein
MKKIILSIVGIATLILAGCAADTAAGPTDIAAVGISAVETAIPKGVSESTPEVSEEASEPPDPETEATATADKPEKSAAGVTDSEKTQSVSNANSGKASENTSNDSGKSKSEKTATAKSPAKTETPKQKKSSAKNEKPKKEKEKSAEKPKSKPKPEPSKPKSAYDAPYDTVAMSANAKAYGESIGMTWSASLTPDNCSWEAPGATSEALSGNRLKKAIESSIRRIKKLQQDNGYQPGEFHFKVLFVAAGDGEYTIYFLMG